MKNLQLTDNYTLWGLNKEEYDEANLFIDKFTTEENENRKQAIQILFKAKFKIDITTMVGDTIIEDCYSLPKKVVDKIIERIPITTKKDAYIYKCFVKPNWKTNHNEYGVEIHEDSYSSVNCALAALGKPYAVIITKKP